MKSFAGDKTLVDFALKRTGRVRLAMRGRSMLPLLHEPQVLEVRPAERLKIGDIVLFDMDRRLVAHRIVEFANDKIVTAGDAQPHYVENIAGREVLGVVAGVTASAEADAKRVDGIAFNVRGWVYARTRRLRAFCISALPFLRPRDYAPLVAIISALVRDDDTALAAAIRSVDRPRLAQMAERHRCVALLHEALRRLPDDEVAAQFLASFRTKRWSTALQNAKLREQVASVVGVLNAAGLQPVLLKGAARLWCGDRDSEAHDSVDIDLMLPKGDIPRARVALLAAGYAEGDVARHRAFYERHHHAPPLFPSHGGVSVELHHALAPEGSISLDTSFAALESLCEDVSTARGRARRFNRLGTALHLIVHGHHRYAMRDLYLLARLLAGMSEDERRALQTMLRDERIARIEMKAMVAQAAALAGTSWTTEAAVHRFERWYADRQDLPKPLRMRSDCYDAWIAGANKPLVRRLRDVWRASKLDFSDDRPFSGARAGARRWLALGAALVIASYVPLMRRA